MKRAWRYAIAQDNSTNVPATNLRVCSYELAQCQELSGGCSSASVVQCDRVDLYSILLVIMPRTVCAERQALQAGLARKAPGFGPANTANKTLRSLCIER